MSAAAVLPKHLERKHGGGAAVGNSGGGEHLGWGRRVPVSLDRHTVGVNTMTSLATLACDCHPCCAEDRVRHTAASQWHVHAPGPALPPLLPGLTRTARQRGWSAPTSRVRCTLCCLHSNSCVWMARIGLTTAQGRLQGSGHHSQAGLSCRAQQLLSQPTCWAAGKSATEGHANQPLTQPHALLPCTQVQGA